MSSASRRSSSARARPRTSAPDTSQCPALPNTRTQEVFQSIVKGRKSWKTLRGGEVVWPPELEAALLEGLESYQPDDSRETRLLGRFPMRNRFISDFIFDKTGKRRTPKQVGSRLQQLRDTASGSKRLLYLLSPRQQSEEQGQSRPHPNLLHNYNNFHCDSDSSSDASSLPPTPTEACFETMGPPRTVVHIDIVPDDTPTTPVRSFEREVIGEEQQWPSMGGGIVRASQHPRPIHCIDPTITLLSNSPISARSVFQVISSGMTVFSETTPLSPAGPAPEAASGALLYKTTLVPGFWDKISNSSDPTQYVIVQDVIQDGPTSSSTMFSAVYKFSYCRSGDSDHQFLPSPLMDQHDNGAKFASNQPMVSFDNLLAMDSTSFGDLMDYESFDTYFNFGHLDIKGCMDPRSPSVLSVGSAAGYEPLAFGDERDHYNQLPVSPMSACFPPGLSNYVS